MDKASAMQDLLTRGGPALWVIAGLSVLTVTLILWKIWRLSLAGAWAAGGAAARVEALCRGEADPGAPRATLRQRFVSACLAALADPALDAAAQREEVTRIAMRKLADLRSGLRALELIAAIAPLIGLLGTVLGMIEAFQALQASGSDADATVLAGGIWQALLTTAAGMAVAIPATVAQSWFEGVIERVQLDFEDAATRLFARAGKPGTGAG